MTHAKNRNASQDPILSVGDKPDRSDGRGDMHGNAATSLVPYEMGCWLLVHAMKGKVNYYLLCDNIGSLFCHMECKVIYYILSDNIGSLYCQGGLVANAGGGEESGVTQRHTW